MEDESQAALAVAELEKVEPAATPSEEQPAGQSTGEQEDESQAASGVVEPEQGEPVAAPSDQQPADESQAASGVVEPEQGEPVATPSDQQPAEEQPAAASSGESPAGEVDGEQGDQAAPQPASPSFRERAAALKKSATKALGQLRPPSGSAQKKEEEGPPAEEPAEQPSEELPAAVSSGESPAGDGEGGQDVPQPASPSFREKAAALKKSATQTLGQLRPTSGSGQKKAEEQPAAVSSGDSPAGDGEGDQDSPRRASPSFAERAAALKKSATKTLGQLRPTSGSSQKKAEDGSQAEQPPEEQPAAVSSGESLVGDGEGDQDAPRPPASPSFRERAEALKKSATKTLAQLRPTSGSSQKKAEDGSQAEQPPEEQPAAVSSGDSPAGDGEGDQDSPRHVSPSFAERAAALKKSATKTLGQLRPTSGSSQKKAEDGSQAEQPPEEQPAAVSSGESLVGDGEGDQDAPRPPASPSFRERAEALKKSATKALEQLRPTSSTSQRKAEEDPRAEEPPEDSPPADSEVAAEDPRRQPLAELGQTDSEQAVDNSCKGRLTRLLTRASGQCQSCGHRIGRLLEWLYTRSQDYLERLELWIARQMEARKREACASELRRMLIEADLLQKPGMGEQLRQDFLGPRAELDEACSGMTFSQAEVVQALQRAEQKERSSLVLQVIQGQTSWQQVLPVLMWRVIVLVLCWLVWHCTVASVAFSPTRSVAGDADSGILVDPQAPSSPAAAASTVALRPLWHFPELSLVELRQVEDIVFEHNHVSHALHVAMAAKTQDGSVALRSADGSSVRVEPDGRAYWLPLGGREVYLADVESLRNLGKRAEAGGSSLDWLTAGSFSTEVLAAAKA